MGLSKNIIKTFGKSAVFAVALYSIACGGRKECETRRDCLDECINERAEHECRGRLNLSGQELADCREEGSRLCARVYSEGGLACSRSCGEREECQDEYCNRTAMVPYCENSCAHPNFIYNRSGR